MSEKILFPGMHQLAPCVYLYEPSDQHDIDHVRGPHLVVLSTWMSASPSNIMKYVKAYQTQYPQAHILMLRSDALDFIYRGRKALEWRLRSAVTAVRSTCLKSSTPEVLLHVFSNGGSLQAATLLRSYYQTTGDRFPTHSTILDSCPGRPKFAVAFRVLELPWINRPFYIRLPVMVPLYLTFGLWWLTMFALRMHNPFETLWQGLNNTEEKEVQRVYIYSDADDMVPWADIEEHAMEASSKGFKVELKKFQGSGHVAHARVGNGERYWKVVNQLWERTVD